ncbi:hypothetical protein D3C78_630690 [compost metagenome]
MRDVRHHHRQRFSRAMFALPQPGDRQNIASIANQMKPAEAFDGHNPPGFERCDRRLQRVFT